MKKAIIYSILISILLIAGSYYYFFIMQGEPEEPKLPSKVKILMPQPKAEEVKKGEGKKVEPKKEIKEEKKEVAPKEPKKEVKEEKKEVAQKEPKKKLKEDKKEGAQKESKKEPEKEKAKPRYYKIEAQYKDLEEAEKVKKELVSLGYHTAKVVKRGTEASVVLSPFTDFYEADYVRKNIEIEAKRKEFRTKGVY